VVVAQAGGRVVHVAHGLRNRLTAEARGEGGAAEVIAGGEGDGALGAAVGAADDAVALLLDPLTEQLGSSTAGLALHGVWKQVAVLVRGHQDLEGDGLRGLLRWGCRGRLFLTAGDKDPTGGQRGEDVG